MKSNDLLLLTNGISIINETIMNIVLRIKHTPNYNTEKITSKLWHPVNVSFFQLCLLFYCGVDVKKNNHYMRYLTRTPHDYLFEMLLHNKSVSLSGNITMMKATLLYVDNTFHNEIIAVHIGMDLMYSFLWYATLKDPSRYTQFIEYRVHFFLVSFNSAASSEIHWVQGSSLLL